MNARQKKKLWKRDGYFHYKDYKLWQRVLQIAEAKYGKTAVIEWIAKNQDARGSNLIKITTTRKGWPIDVDLYSHVYPVAMQSGIPEKYQWHGPIMCPMIPLNARCVAIEEYEELRKKYTDYLNKVSTASSACEAMGMEVD